MILIQSAVMNRPNPKINVNKQINWDCSFVISEILGDYPIIYASPSFSLQTGYTQEEIIGRNCRFLQSPTGHCPKGSNRPHIDNYTLYHMANQIAHFVEVQVNIINFTKLGHAFPVLLTVIPISIHDSGVYTHFIAFQQSLLVTPYRNPSTVDSYNEHRLTGYINHQTLSLETSVPSIQPFESTLISPVFAPGSPSYQSSASGRTNLLSFPVKPLFSTRPRIDFASEIASPLSDDSKLTVKRILTTLADPVMIVSSRGIILYVSSSTETRQIFQRDMKLIIGFGLPEIFHSGDAIGLMRNMKSQEVGVKFYQTCRIMYSEYKWSLVELMGRKIEFNTKKKTKCYVVTLRKRELDKLLSSNMLQLFTRDWRNLFLKVSKSGIILNVFTLQNQFKRGDSLIDIFSKDDYDCFCDNRNRKTIFQTQRCMKISGIDFNHLVLLNCDTFSYLVATIEAVKLPIEQLDCIFEAFDIHRPAAIEYELNLLKAELAQLKQTINE